jgi:hypothetical protein
MPLRLASTTRYRGWYFSKDGGVVKTELRRAAVGGRLFLVFFDNLDSFIFINCSV